MYPRYNINQNRYNMYNDERFFGGGVLAPLLVGGIAGYAIGNNGFGNSGYGRPNCCYPPYTYNNFYYQYPYNYYY